MAFGLFGGSFDPIHYGHLILAEEIRNSLHLEKIIFIPSKISPREEKQDLMSTSNQRLEMVKMAIAGNPCFEVSDIEMERKGISYTVDTVKYFANNYKENFYFLVGADNILDLPNWYKWRDILKLCQVAIGARPGFPIEPLLSQQSLFGKQLSQNLQRHFIEIPLTHISSSEIRQRYLKNRNTKYLLPTSVDQYIRTNKIYCL